MTSPEYLRQLREDFAEIDQLAGYSVLLHEESIRLMLVAIALERLVPEMADVSQVLQEAASAARTAAETAATSSNAAAEAVQSAINRLADNQEISEEAKNAILGDLNTAKAASEASAQKNTEITGLADTIDPTITTPDGGGVITDPENPGEVVTPE